MKLSRNQIYLGLAFTHLILLVTGATYVEFDRLGKFGRAIEFVRRFSGADSSYGFFPLR